MAPSLETNKIVGSILTALLIAVGSANIARILYKPEKLEEPVVRFAEEGEAEGAMAAEAAEPEAPAEEEPITALIAQADLDRGAQVARACAACHSLEKGGPTKVGPNLWGVVGRPVASVEGFSYSSALQGLGGVWDYERLDAFLADPKGFAPGNRMAFRGVRKRADRAALIAYLRSLADEPAPLPER